MYNSEYNIIYYGSWKIIPRKKTIINLK